MKRLIVLLCICIALPLIGCATIAVPGGDLSRELAYRLQYRQYLEQKGVTKVCRFTTPDGPAMCTEVTRETKKDDPPK